MYLQSCSIGCDGIMNLIDDLKQMKRKGRFVVSLTYIIDRLESIESHDNDLDEQLTSNQPNRFAELLQSAKKEVNQNRTLSKVD
jgi:hypothetical protein